MKIGTTDLLSRNPPGAAWAFEAIFRKVVGLMASHLEQGAFTFGDIRKRL